MKDITITFTASELLGIIADYYGYNRQDICIEDYSEQEIKEIILDKIL